MFTRYYIILFLFKLPAALFAFATDSNIVISGSKDEYEFVWNKAEVQVKQHYRQTYFASFYRASIPIREIYSSQTSIDEVDFTVNGIKPGDIKPRYTYFDDHESYYSDLRVCSFELPLKKAGSSGSVSFSKTIKDPRFFTSVYFSDSYQIMQKEVSIKVPRWIKVELKEMNFGTFRISKASSYDEENDADIYTYTMSDLPVLEGEINSPGSSYIVPHILVLTREANYKGNKKTYFNTLADQYAWYRQMTANIGNNEAMIKATAMEITSGLNNDEDKIKAIFYWVQNNIRYIAFENGIAGFKPDKADEVIRKKYGDCKGMANATRELLRSLQFDARFCWIGTKDIAYDYSTPSLAIDNHMICALNFKGNMYFLDATETFLPFNKYGERIQGRQCLVEDGMNFILTNIPSTTFMQNLDSEKRIMEISGTHLKGTATHIWLGEEKQLLLLRCNSTKKELIRERFESYLAKNNNNYSITGFNTSDLNKIDSTLTAYYTIDHKNGVTVFDKEYYVTLDFDNKFTDSNIDTVRRSLDYWFPYKQHVYRETTLMIPTGYQPSSIPSNFHLNRDNYAFNITYEVAENKIIYKKLLVIKDIKLTKKMFSEWNKDISQLNAAYNEQIILTAK